MHLLSNCQNTFYSRTSPPDWAGRGPGRRPTQVLGFYSKSVVLVYMYMHMYMYMCCVCV